MADSWAGLAARRIATAVLTLGLVTLVVFLLVHAAPGGPLEPEPGEELLLARDDQQAALRALYHLDQPLHRQYTMWLGDVLCGDLGVSFNSRRPVAEEIGERIGLTLTLNTLALGVMLLVALPLGLAAALRPGSWVDRAASGITILLYAVPTFWAGLLLQGWFYGRLGWLPLAGVRSPDAELLGDAARVADRLAHLVLPVVCLSYGGLAYLSRFVRASLLEGVAGQSWRAARARGLSLASVVWRHGLRQAAVPLLTLAGFLLPALVTGSVIVETVFALPGLGRLFIDATFQRDVPVVLGLTLVTGAVTLAGVVAADLTYALVDPRVRRG